MFTEKIPKSFGPHAFSAQELGSGFNLDFALNWGLLPKIYQLEGPAELSQFLRSYASVYLREEIKEEQIVRQFDSFARFLVVAAQHNTKIINYSKIAREAQTEAKTVERYFSVLEDTFLGFHLDAYHRSVRKAQRMRPKFHFFDPGVKRADRFYYIRTKEDLEIDLLVERPGKELWAIEIKSSDRVDSKIIQTKLELAKDLKVKRFIFASQETTPRTVKGVDHLPWREALRQLFMASTKTGG